MGRPVPEPVSVQLVIDSGSRRSSLIPGIVDHLNPTRFGEARVETSTASMAANLYWVRLEFPGTSLGPISEHVVARMPLPPSLHAFQGLIGRDLLHRWESFLYEGRRGRLTVRDTPHWLFGWLW
jgi:hypothetical protein